MALKKMNQTLLKNFSKGTRRVQASALIKERYFLSVNIKYLTAMAQAHIFSKQSRTEPMCSHAAAVPLLTRHHWFDTTPLVLPVMCVDLTCIMYVADDIAASETQLFFCSRGHIGQDTFLLTCRGRGLQHWGGVMIGTRPWASSLDTNHSGMGHIFLPRPLVSWDVLSSNRCCAYL